MSEAARLSHLFVRVVDLAATRHFYVDLLGLDVLMEEPGYLRVGNADGWHLGLEEGEASRSARTGSSWSFESRTWTSRSRDSPMPACSSMLPHGTCHGAPGTHGCAIRPAIESASRPDDSIGVAWMTPSVSRGALSNDPAAPYAAP